MITLENHHSFSYERIGEFHSAGPWVHPRRKIASFELILALEGTVKICEAGRKYEILPDDMLLLEPGLEHYGWETASLPVAFYWFHFTTDLPLPFKTVSGKNVYHIKQLLKLLLHSTNTPGYSHSYADALGYLIYEELAQFQRETSSNPILVGKIFEYVRNNRNRIFTVSDIAAHFGYNPDYISRLFKSAYGTNLKEYITGQKLLYAKDLLLTTDMNIRQISAMLGYQDENLFLKFFLYHEGISPTVFRNNYYNTHINNQ